MKQKPRQSGKPGAPADMLISAARAGNDDVVLFLLAAEVDVNGKNVLGVTGLHAAIAGRHLSTCQILIANGYQLDSNSKDGGSLLHLAFIMADLDVLKYLVANGLDVNAQIDLDGLDIVSCCCELTINQYLVSQLFEEFKFFYETIGQAQHPNNVVSMYLNNIMKGDFSPILEKLDVIIVSRSS
jgi:hypothetical protein